MSYFLTPDMLAPTDFQTLELTPMEPIQRAALVRASSALSVAMADASSATRLKSFRQLVIGLAQAKSIDQIGLFDEHSDHLLFEFRQKAALVGDEVWRDQDINQLVQAFIGSIAPVNLLDNLARWSVQIPESATTALIASGFTTDSVAEKGVKAVYPLDLSRMPTEPSKCAGMVVLSKGLFSTAAGSGVFLRELEKATLRAQNGAILDLVLANSPATEVSGGATLTGLRNALAASLPSSGYVVVASSQDLAVLSTYLEVQALQNIAFVPYDALPAGTEMAVIAASHVALADHGMTFKPSTQATVQMSQTPVDPVAATTVSVSLFQQNLVALLVERSFRFAVEELAVVTVRA